ncbi:MAG: hypothetical protein ACERKD_03890 [Prolixibacteraceae bacterium]
MKRSLLPFIIGLAIFSLSNSCSVTSHTMKTPNYHIEFYKADFDYSPQVTAEATSVRVFMIDWSRIFGWKTGDLSSDRFQPASQDLAISGNIVASPVVGAVSAIIPVLGDYGKGRVSNYALYNLMHENPGYDVVIYPQYEAKKFVVPFFFSRTKVEVKARLGKIN